MKQNLLLLGKFIGYFWCVMEVNFLSFKFSKMDKKEEKFWCFKDQSFFSRIKSPLKDFWLPNFFLKGSFCYQKALERKILLPKMSPWKEAFCCQKESLKGSFCYKKNPWKEGFGYQNRDLSRWMFHSKSSF